jgi:hypothetical protein
MRGRRQTGDSNRVNAANTARSAQDSRGLHTWRRDTATSWRSTRISAFFDCALRASRPSQAMTCRKIRYSSRTATTGDHARLPLSSDAAGTAVDDQFGTHRVLPTGGGRTTSVTSGEPYGRARVSATMAMTSRFVSRRTCVVRATTHRRSRTAGLFLAYLPAAPGAAGHLTIDADMDGDGDRSAGAGPAAGLDAPSRTLRCLLATFLRSRRGVRSRCGAWRGGSSH